MNAKDLLAELSIKMIELEKAIDVGMPYSELRKIYNTIKVLQYRLAVTEPEVRNTVDKEVLIWL